MLYTPLISFIIIYLQSQDNIKNLMYPQCFYKFIYVHTYVFLTYIFTFEYKIQINA